MSVNYISKENSSFHKFEEGTDTKEISVKQNEDEFWADTLTTEENRKHQEERNHNRSHSLTSDKDHSSTCFSNKKPRIDLSMFKGVDFDDLVFEEKNNGENNYNEDIESAPNFESQILISEINIKDNACSHINLNTTINDENFINISKYRRNRCTSQKSSSKSVENKIIMTLLNKASIPAKNSSNAIVTMNHLSKSKVKKKRNMSTVEDRSKPINQIKQLLPTPSKAERLNKLYLKNKEKLMKLELKRRQELAEKKLKETEGCSFKPKLNKKFNNSHKAGILQMSMYDRQVSWNNQRQEKINKDKNFNALQEKYECTFVPEINQRTLDFENNWKPDRTTKNYIRRVKNAKTLNEELKSKLNPDYNEKYNKLVKNKMKSTYTNTHSSDDNWQTFNPTVIKMQNLNTAKLELREQLHSLNIDCDNYI